MLLRPSATFKALIGEGNEDVALFPMILAGVMGLHLWADVFDLGRQYETGRILSGGLILGPVIGVLWLCLLGLLGLWLGNLMDSRHTSSFQLHVLIPPFPLKNMLWVKVFGADGIRRLFSKPVLKQYLQAWSWVNAAIIRAKDAVSGGELRYPVLLGGISRLAGLFLPLTVVVWVAANLLSQNGFGRAEEILPFDGWFLALKALVFLAFGYSWLRMLMAGFQLNLWRTLVAGIGSLLLSLVTILWSVSFFTGIHLM
jgi:hypothetical protein